MGLKKELYVRARRVKRSSRHRFRTSTRDVDFREQDTFRLRAEGWCWAGAAWPSTRLGYRRTWRNFNLCENEKGTG